MAFGDDFAAALATSLPLMLELVDLRVADAKVSSLALAKIARRARVRHTHSKRALARAPREKTERDAE